MTNGSRIISSLLRTVPAWSDFDDRHLKAAALLQKSLRCLQQANAFCSQSIHLALSGVITSRAKSLTAGLKAETVVRFIIKGAVYASNYFFNRKRNDSQ
jgi:hypothetical protein